ncbi:MAG TPA: DUF2071 domain-containing protein [Polyangiaceae bacterium]
MPIELVGTEALSLELTGATSLARARVLLKDLAPEVSDDGNAVVGLLLFRMQGMHVRGTPGPKVDYGEALWRIGVVHEGAPAWFALRCDLDHPLVMSLGRRAIRYPVRAARFAFEDGGSACSFAVRAEGVRLALRASITGRASSPVPPRRVLSRVTGVLYEIPWREDPPPEVHDARIEWTSVELARATLGAPVSWLPGAVLLRGRVHRCGLARRC